MLNKVMIIGNCGKETEMRFTPNGKPVTSFSVAVNSKFGEQETTEWFRIVCWNKLAETCNQYLRKGQQVYVEGRQQTSHWEDKDNKIHVKTEVVANRVLFLGKRTEKSEHELHEVDLAEDLPF